MARERELVIAGTVVIRCTTVSCDTTRTGSSGDLVALGVDPRRPR